MILLCFDALPDRAVAGGVETLDSVLETLRNEAAFVFPPMTCSVDLIRLGRISKEKDHYRVMFSVFVNLGSKTVKVVGYG